MSTTSAKRRKRLLLLLMFFPFSGLAGLLIWIATQTKANAIKSVIKGTQWGALVPYFVAMARHETGDFTSNVYKSLNSMFGMKVPSKRPFLGKVGPAAPDGGFYAKYPSDIQSVKDLVEWLRYTSFPVNIFSLADFVQALRTRGYFTDSYDNYYNGLKRFMND